MNHNDINNTNHYNGWRKDSGKVSTHFIPKGSNPLTEHYSALNENIKEEHKINDRIKQLLDNHDHFKGMEKIHCVSDSHDQTKENHKLKNPLLIIDSQQDFIIPEPSEFEID